jgi:hypothetical protein
MWSRASGTALAVIGTFIAFASKEHAVVLPAFVALEAWAYDGKRRIDRAEAMRILRVAMPYIVTVALYLGFRAAFYPIVPARAGNLTFIDARIATLETFGELLRVLVLPFSYSIQRAPIRLDDAFRVIHDPKLAAMGVALIAAMGIAAWMWRKTGAATRLAGLAVGLAALFPVANIAAARMTFLFAERFLYIPFIGFALSFVPAAPRGPAIDWRRIAPWPLLLALFAWATVLHTRHFLDDRHLWEHELAENPKQPSALRFACQEAMHRQRYRESLALAVRGYEASRGYAGSQPDRVEFALRAARSLEAITLDADRASLERIAELYNAFFLGKGTARIDIEPVHVAIDGAGNEAHNFRVGDPMRLSQAELWRAIVASRLGQCDVALAGARRFLAGNAREQRLREPSGRVNAVLVLGRCGQIDEALAAAATLDAREPAIAELTKNLEWIRALPTGAPADLDAALAASRARALLLDRGGAYRALVPWRDAIVADPRGAMFFARTAWAAGEDGAARSALSHLPQQQADALLTAWSRELGR